MIGPALERRRSRSGRLLLAARLTPGRPWRTMMQRNAMASERQQRKATPATEAAMMAMGEPPLPEVESSCDGGEATPAHVKPTSEATATPSAVDASAAVPSDSESLAATDSAARPR